MPAMPDRSDQDSAAADRVPGRHRPGSVTNHRCNWPPPAIVVAERTSLLRRPQAARREAL